MEASTKRAFTLIELLTVIAIIAVLAALLLPVFARVREQTKLTTCMSNMHDIARAANIYKTDNGDYPCMLLGSVQRADGLPWTIGDPQPPVPAGQIKRGFLYPSYIKSIETFHCPDDLDTDQTKAVLASFSPNSAWSAALMAQSGHDYPLYGSGCYDCFKWLPTSFQTAPVLFYAYDSYDVSSFVLQDGSRRQDPTTGQPGYQVVYSKDWNAVLPRGLDPRQDANNQLKYPNPPLDDTIIAWCNYHVTTGHGEKSPVLFASGTAKPIDFRQMVQKGWNLAGHRAP